MDFKQQVIDKVKNEFGNTVKEITDFRNDLCFTVDKTDIINLAKFLKGDEEFQFITCKDITAIDWATRKNRFTVVYQIYSYKNNFPLRIKAVIENEPYEIESVTSIWAGANWYERETFDMYGIVFLNHPDLRRMYMPEGFQYHPLRKDFPVLGIPGSLPLPNKAD